MGKLFAPPEMHDGATVSHDGVTFTIKDGAIDNVPDHAAAVFIESHGFTGTKFSPEIRIVERLVEVPGAERIVEKLIPTPDDNDPNSVPELKINEMKRGELFAALRGLGVTGVMPPITNDELRDRLHKAVADKSAEAKAQA